MKTEPRMWLRFVYDDGSTVKQEVGRVTALKMPVQKVLFHVDRLEDGKHLVIGNIEVLPEGRKLKRIDVLRSTDDPATVS